MQLITPEIREQLLANGRDPDGDHHPVVKLFNPTGAATWLITQMDPEEHNILFGLADMGFGCPEVGSIYLPELEQYKGRLGLGIERDLYFEAQWPLSVYAEAARECGAITTDSEHLQQATGGRIP